MKKRTWKKGLALLLGLVLGIEAPYFGLLPARPAYGYTERSATVNASSLNVRSGPGTSYTSVTKLDKGTPVMVTNETTGNDGRLWYQIRFSGGTGYVLGTYVRFPVAYSYNSDFEAFLNSQGFPESYKDGLRQLHAQYPNWVFVAQQTGLDWNTVIQNENMLPRSLIHKDSVSSQKSLQDGAYDWDRSTWTGFDGSTWVAASEDIIRYYMDPRNFLDEVYIFQFMNHEYDSATQTREGLQALVQGTFLEGNVITAGSGSGDPSGGSVSSGTSFVNPGGAGQSGGGVSSGSSIGPGFGPGPGNSGSTGGSPAPAGDQGVRLQGPQASISKHEAERVASSGLAVVGKGPGFSDEQAQTGSAPQGGVQAGAAPQGDGAQAGAPPQGGGVQGSGSPVGPGGSPSPSSSGPAMEADPSQNTGSEAVSYVDIIMNAAQVSGVNPYVLTAMIIQEQGSDGRGNSIKGTNSSYPGYYNYFNVGAYAADGMGAVERGLWYASQAGSYGRPWNTPEKSIIGGAQFYGENYVKAGQDTFYLKKYNVQGSNLYKHQYMTNVDGAAAEGSIFAESYSSKVKALPLQFKIPVYTGMPDTPCPKPTGDGSPNNKLKGLGVEGFSLTPTFNRDVYSYDLIVDHSVGAVNVQAEVIDATAAVVSGAGTVQLAAGNNEIQVLVRAQNGSERVYQIHVVRQDNGPTYSGAGGVNPGGTVVPGGVSGSPGTSQGPGISAGPGGGSPSGGAGSAPPSAAPQTGAPQGGASGPGGDNVIVIQ